MPLYSCTTLASLSLNNVDCHIDGCWTILNIEELLTANAVRGENQPIPRAHGARPFPWRTDQSVYMLEMVFGGDNNHMGVDYSDPYVGVLTNVEYFRAQVVNPPTAPTATVAGVLTLRGGSTRNANVQPRVLTVKGSGGGPFLDGLLELVVPSGRFA